MKSVKVITRTDRLKTLIDKWHDAAGDVVDIKFAKELFTLMRGRESHGTYINMTELYLVHAVTQDGARVAATYNYYDMGEKIVKGTTELPDDWISLELTIRRHRNNGDYSKNGVFPLAIRNGDTMTLHEFPLLY